MPSINVVDDRFILPLLYTRQLQHAYGTASVVEAVEEFPFKLVPVVNGLGLEVSVPVKGITF